MTKNGLLAIFCLCFATATAQEIKLTSGEIEAIFLRQNLELIAEQMNIPIADAAIAEARVWDNPEISISDINVWHAGREKQFSVELSQMISLTGRRTKLANVERVGREIAIAEFEELLRELRLDLRSSIAELLYLQNVKTVFEAQQTLLQNVIVAYETQVANGNIPRNELLRLQTALFEVEDEINEMRTEFNGLQTTLKNLLAINPLSVSSGYDFIIVIAEEENNFPSPETLIIGSLIETALLTRPDLQAAKLQSEMHRKEIIYQRSLAMPDISIGAQYDRYGGIWDNYFSVGFGVEIPIFNRNRAAIRTAQYQLRQNDFLIEKNLNTFQNEIIESYRNYTNSYNFLNNNLRNPVLREIDQMLENYGRNLLLRNISMLEYMDFMESHRTTKEIFYRSQKELKLQFEQLQFSVGQDIN
jgi:cobalt-zinc-cadmium efflux system outer membrane protein